MVEGNFDFCIVVASSILRMIITMESFVVAMLEHHGETQSKTQQGNWSILMINMQISVLTNP